MSIVGPRGYVVAHHLFPLSPLLGLSDGNHNIHSRFVRILHVVLFSSFQRAPFIHLKGLKAFRFGKSVCANRNYLNIGNKELRCIRPSNEDPTIEQRPEPIIPHKRQRQRPLSADESWTDDDSPQKKPRTPQTPSKAAQKKAEVAQRRQWKDD